MRKKFPCLNEKAGGLFCKWKMHHRIGRDKKVHTNENAKNGVGFLCKITILYKMLEKHMGED